MNIISNTLKKYGQVLSLFAILLIPALAFAQKPAVPQLEKMPAALETDFALSALPPQLRRALPFTC